MSGLEFATSEGEPSHFYLLRICWQQFLFARHCFRSLVISDLDTIAGACERDHAHGRMVQALLLVEELCYVCLDEEWPIPEEIEIGVGNTEEEGQ